MNLPKVSIIIPLYVISQRFVSDLKYFEDLEYPNFEILIISDKIIRIPNFSNNVNVKLILTGKKITGPAEKRDCALKYAKGKLCAFIDDDAYPDKKWLKKAVVHFDHPFVAAVGGPGLTPKEDGYWEQLTGVVYSSFFCGGYAQYRFVKGKMQLVNDYPAYNLVVRKEVLKKVGGYGSHFYGGEDTFLCLKIIKKGYKILYDPEVVVYHHRRALFSPYLRQIANIGKHRGYFAKKFPETSRRFTYFIPSFLTLSFFGLFVLSFTSQAVFFVFVSLNTFLFLLSTLSVLGKTTVLNSFFVSIGIFLTHIVYGTYFIKGILTRNLTH